MPNADCGAALKWGKVLTNANQDLVMIGFDAEQMRRFLTGDAGKKAFLMLAYIRKDVEICGEHPGDLLLTSGGLVYSEGCTQRPASPEEVVLAWNRALNIGTARGTLLGHIITELNRIADECTSNRASTAPAA